MDYPYQVMPPLSDMEFEALKEDIYQRGVLVAIEFDENGNILDGHNRLRVCKELNITDYPRVIRAGMSETEKRSYARSINLLRRHLTQEQRRELIKQELIENPSKSDRQIGKILGIDHKTVGAQRKELVKSGEIPQLKKTIGSDGKERPREVVRRETPVKPVSVFMPTAQEERLLKKPEVVERMSTEGWGSIIYTNRRINQESKSARKSIDGINFSEADFRLIRGDIRSGYPEIADKSVDCIITDAPYGREYVELYSCLGKLAGRVLKDGGGSCLVMTGQVALPEAMSQLCEHLKYHWLICCLANRSSPGLQWLHVAPLYKAVLWFTKGAYKGDLIPDVIIAPPDKDGADRDLHHWGQSEYVFEQLVERFTDPGQTVLDPYVGGGCTAHAAVQLRRKFIGCDISQECIDTTRKRVLETMNQV